MFIIGGKAEEKKVATAAAKAAAAKQAAAKQAAAERTTAANAAKAAKVARTNVPLQKEQSMGDGEIIDGV